MLILTQEDFILSPLDALMVGVGKKKKKKNKHGGCHPGLDPCFRATCSLYPASVVVVTHSPFMLAWGLIAALNIFCYIYLVAPLRKVRVVVDPSPLC